MCRTKIAEKCSNKCDAHAKLLFYLLNLSVCWFFFTSRSLPSRNTCPVRSPRLCVQRKLSFSTFLAGKEETTDESGNHFGSYQLEGGSNVASISTNVMTIGVFLRHIDNQKIFKWKFRSRNHFLGMIFFFTAQKFFVRYVLDPRKNKVDTKK